MASTNQINKVVESIGRSDHSEFVFVYTSFFLEEGVYIFTFFLYCLFYDDLVKPLLSGLF